VGTNPDLVQASGGNTSWKDGQKVWVKGSGKKLKDALAEDIFTVINFETLSEAEILACEDFSNISTNSITPSIEANFHIFLKNKFVTHLHSLGSIAIGITFVSLSDLCFDSEVHRIPYTRPGVSLANEIKRAEIHSEKILLLQNHGVIFSGQSCDEIEEKIEKFETRVKEYFAELPSSNSFPDWIEILTSGVLTPDEAVFLGKKPFVRSEKLQTSSVGINSKGELLFPDGFSANRTELAKFYVRVAKLIETKAQVTYLPESEVQGLLGWDKEKIRIAMSK
jgi:rhamnose utilization protein RhaD (predicted bifunctional aldolase and dehydrogenase)